MAGRHTRFPFRWALPFGQLLVCAVLLWPYWHDLISDLRPRSTEPLTAQTPHATIPAPPNVKPGKILIIEVKRTSPEEQRSDQVKSARILIPGSLNFPAFFFDYFIYGLVKDNSVRYDEAFRRSWRAVTWPLLGFIFWWMAGRAVEALLAARKGVLLPRIGPPEVTAAIALLLFTVPLSLFFVFGGKSRDLEGALLATGAAFWAVAGLIMLLARIAQWRVRKANGPATAYPASI